MNGVDEQFAEHLRGEILHARAGKQGMLSKERVDLMHAIWKILALAPQLFSIDIMIRKTPEKDASIIKANVATRREDRVREAFHVLDVKSIEMRIQVNETLWFAPPYRFVFIGESRAWINDPSWLTVTERYDARELTPNIRDQDSEELQASVDRQIQRTQRLGNIHPRTLAAVADRLRVVVATGMDTDSLANLAEAVSQAGLTIEQFQNQFMNLRPRQEPPTDAMEYSEWRRRNNIGENVDAREQIIQRLIDEARRMSQSTIVEAEVNTLVNNIQAAGITLQEFQSEYLGQPFEPLQRATRREALAAWREPTNP